MTTTRPPTPPRPASETPPSTPGRDTFWDAVRGICILAVVWTHTRVGIPYDGGPYAWNVDYWLIQRQLINFAVAVFVFLAGYFVSASKVTGRAGPWLRSRAVRLGVPFLVWSVGYTLLMAWIDGDRALGHLVRDVALGASAKHLYFIVALLQLVALTPLLLRVLETRWRWLPWAVTPAYLVVLYAQTLPDGVPPPFANTWFAAWFVFYWAGLWARRYGTPPALGVRGAVLATAVAVVASVVEAYVLVAAGVDVGFAAGQLTVTSTLTSLAVIALLLALHERRRSRASLAAPGNDDGDRWLGLDRLGRDSYGIFYVHLLWFVLAWQVLGLPPADGEFAVLPVLQVGELVVAVALSLAVIAVVRRVIGRRAASRLLGF
ncbi:acyltransferase [Serinibacter arcticus]|uniref:Acyltransferase 3 domain-containing protein n=1 Tax=Serinibacter arcticus TaxID=1655435 RepID=A0A4Z1E342_9MICO|nr:acyltransferase [Serinibacter arcticus]TGO05378.1 hypothetical protein SERN_1382 [Serinibacter arcticus]